MHSLPAPPVHWPVVALSKCQGAVRRLPDACAPLPPSPRPFPGPRPRRSPLHRTRGLRALVPRKEGSNSCVNKEGGIATPLLGPDSCCACRATPLQLPRSGAPNPSRPPCPVRLTGPARLMPLSCSSALAFRCLNTSSAKCGVGNPELAAAPSLRHDTRMVHSPHVKQATLTDRSTRKSATCRLQTPRAPAPGPRPWAARASAWQPAPWDGNAFCCLLAWRRSTKARHRRPPQPF